MKKHKYKIIAGIVILAVLAVTFWWGGNAPGLGGMELKETIGTALPETSPDIMSAETAKPTEDTLSVTQQPNVTAIPTVKPSAAIASPTIVPTATAENHSDAQITLEPSVVQTTMPTVEVKKDEKLRCTISVKCDKILENISYLPEEKRGLIPSDGVILQTTDAVFNDGENVFNVLQRELKRAKIHLEFVNTPIYNSVYIEGINNIYEFDCGENSGWMYSVNGEFPRYGSSGYKLKDGDKIEWVYTCDLGRDVGGYYASSE